ncbi:hypothetical protein Bca101_028718 [Brassica carinata]
MPNPNMTKFRLKMPLEYTAISELNSSKKEWKIRVLVSRMWEYFSKNKPEAVLGLEAILVDEKMKLLSVYLNSPLFSKNMCKGCCGKATPYFNPVTEEIEANKYSCVSCEKDETITTMREIPQELMDLEGRKIIWIICVKGTDKNYRQPSFNVVKLSDKPDVIHNFHANMTMEVENISSEAKNNGLPPCSPLTPITKRQGSLIIDDEAIQESSTSSKRTYKKARGESDSKVENMKKESTKAKH